MPFTVAETFAFLSALLWFSSAVIRLPRNVWFQARVGGGGPNAQFETLLGKLQLMGWLNVGGALCAAISIFCQTRGL
jgi:hypothetical protein